MKLTAVISLLLMSFGLLANDYCPNLRGSFRKCVGETNMPTSDVLIQETFDGKTTSFHYSDNSTEDDTFSFQTNGVETSSTIMGMEVKHSGKCSNRVLKIDGKLILGPTDFIQIKKELSLNKDGNLVLVEYDEDGDMIQNLVCFRD